jgi:chaperone BCS1
MLLLILTSRLRPLVRADLDDFVSQGTRKWYASHGIPYKRSLLLFGSPGAGKTSLIQALAGRYKRNLAILTPSHPEMTDDGLKAAVQRVPSKSIIVLEDVDAIFAEGRSKKDGDKSSLTFSGVLNALDGVGASTGQIFILTTNHREKLDPALIRNGRVDCHVEFTDADAEQAAELFRQFYSEAEDKVALSEAFAKRLFELIEKRKTSISMAALQHYFIIMRRATAKEAAEGVAKILEEAEAHGKLQKEREEAKKEKAEKAEEGGSQEEEDKGDGEGSETPKNSPPKDKQQMHVHVHVH